MKNEKNKLYVIIPLFLLLPLIFGLITNSRTLVNILIEDLIYLHFGIVLFLLLIKYIYISKNKLY